MPTGTPAAPSVTVPIQSFKNGAHLRLILQDEARDLVIQPPRGPELTWEHPNSLRAIARILPETTVVDIQGFRIGCPRTSFGASLTGTLFANFGVLACAGYALVDFRTQRLTLAREALRFPDSTDTYSARLVVQSGSLFVEAVRTVEAGEASLSDTGYLLVTLDGEAQTLVTNRRLARTLVQKWTEDSLDVHFPRGETKLLAGLAGLQVSYKAGKLDFRHPEGELALADLDYLSGPGPILGALALGNYAGEDMSVALDFRAGTLAFVMHAPSQTPTPEGPSRTATVPLTVRTVGEGSQADDIWEIPAEIDGLRARARVIGPGNALYLSPAMSRRLGNPDSVSLGVAGIAPVRVKAEVLEGAVSDCALTYGAFADFGYLWVDYGRRHVVVSKDEPSLNGNRRLGERVELSTVWAGLVTGRLRVPLLDKSVAGLFVVNLNSPNMLTANVRILERLGCGERLAPGRPDATGFVMKADSVVCTLGEDVTFTPDDARVLLVHSESSSEAQAVTSVMRDRGASKFVLTGNWSPIGRVEVLGSVGQGYFLVNGLSLLFDLRHGFLHVLQSTAP